MAKTGRPVSPHVTIYQFPIAALTSIAVRVTGVSLSIGSLGVASLEIASSGSALQLMNDIAMTGPVVAGMAKVVVGFPLVYHYLGGVRHLVWDHYPAVLSNIGVEKASYALAGGSVVLTAGLALI
jgi:succinate dehydrogenase (ubiquinone) cytochrome b560 subunit